MIGKLIMMVLMMIKVTVIDLMMKLIMFLWLRGTEMTVHDTLV